MPDYFGPTLPEISAMHRIGKLNLHAALGRVAARQRAGACMYCDRLVGGEPFYDPEEHGGMCVRCHRRAEEAEAAEAAARCPICGDLSCTGQACAGTV